MERQTLKLQKIWATFYCKQIMHAAIQFIDLIWHLWNKHRYQWFFFIRILMNKLYDGTSDFKITKNLSDFLSNASNACRYTIYWMPYRHFVRIRFITKSILTRNTFFATLLTVSFPYWYYEPLYFFKRSTKITNGRNSCLRDQSVELNGILGRRAAGNLFSKFTVYVNISFYQNETSNFVR